MTHAFQRFGKTCGVFLKTPVAANALVRNPPKENAPHFILNFLKVAFCSAMTGRQNNEKEVRHHGNNF